MRKVTPPTRRSRWGDKPTGTMRGCSNCAKEIYVNRSVKWENVYCSRSCYWTHRRSRRVEEFWKQVDKTGSERGCWLYKGTISFEGYGYFCLSQGDGRRQQWQAHRYAWTLLNGKIPAGKFLLHHCDIRNCVNPEHLYLGTHLENARDAVERGRRNHRWTPVDQLLWPELSKRVKS